VAIGTVLGVLVEAVVYRPLASRAGENALLGIFVASLGLMIAGENLIRLVWGNDTRNLGGFPQHTYTVANVNFSLLQVCAVAAGLAIATILTVVLARTGFGQQVRAVRGNPDMAQAIGIDVRRIFLAVFAIGTLAGGVQALFDGMRFATTPDMGNTPVFYAFVVAFVAGTRRSPLTVFAVGVAIGLVESLSTLWVSDNLSSLTVFGLLFVILSIRSVPSGIRELSGALSRPRRLGPARLGGA
jgi:branched-subunit amino acid ABC-type transport system permease component